VRYYVVFIEPHGREGQSDRQGTFATGKSGCRPRLIAVRGKVEEARAPFRSCKRGQARFLDGFDHSSDFTRGGKMRPDDTLRQLIRSEGRSSTSQTENGTFSRMGVPRPTGPHQRVGTDRAEQNSLGACVEACPSHRRREKKPPSQGSESPRRSCRSCKLR